MKSDSIKGTFITTGALSDIVDVKKRLSWHWMNQKLRALEPGERVSIKCPRGVEMGKFRSTILTNGRRYHIGDWVIGTRTEGEVIHCFLYKKGEYNQA